MPSIRIHPEPPSDDQWADLNTSGHSIQLYERDDELIVGLARFAGAALATGDPFLMIATEQHRRALEQLLLQNGMDLDLYRANGRFVALDAGETLSQFMVDDFPDRLRFLTLTGGLIERASDAAVQTGRHVALFGEMVALLWARGNQRAALELEQLWNELAESYKFYLHCAYSSTLFAGAGDVEALAKVCAEHTHLIERGPLPVEDGAGDQRLLARAITREHARHVAEHIRRYGVRERFV